MRTSVVLLIISILIFHPTITNAQSMEWSKIDLVGVWETDYYQYPSGLKEYRPSNMRARLEVYINIYSTFGLDARSVSENIVFSNTIPKQ